MTMLHVLLIVALIVIAGAGGYLYGQKVRDKAAKIVGKAEAAVDAAEKTL